MGIVKKLLHRVYRTLENDAHELLYLFLEVTRKCNLSCLHCGSDCKAANDTPELTLESWFRIIDYFTHNYSPELMFVITGGEPLVCEGLEEIGRRISRAGRRWGMVTNGLLLSRDKLNRLTDAGLSSITVSLDGSRKAHDTLRNKNGAYDKALGALDAIAGSGIRLRDVVTCVYPGNIGELDEIAETLISKKVPAWRLFRIFPNGRARNNPMLRLDFAETRKMLRWIAEMRPVYRERGLSLGYSCEGYLPMELDAQVRDSLFFCRAGVNIASILCDGTITGCTNNAPMFYEGNILECDFAALWENGFSRFRQRDWMRAGRCAECNEFRDCQGGSIHLWHDETRGSEFCYIHDDGNKGGSKNY